MSFIGVLLGAIGALLGAALEDVEGFFVGGALGYLAGAYFDLLRRLGSVEESLQVLLHKDNSAAAPVSRPTPQPATDQAPPPTTPTAPTAMPEPVLARPARMQFETTATVTSPAATNAAAGGTAAVMDPLADKVQAVYDWVVRFFTTGNVVVKVGLVILFFGVGFLLKYAAEHSLFPIELRLAGVGIGGIIMLIIGWRLRQGRRAYALLLQGGAVGVIYLTLFAAFKFYQFIPPPLAFALMLAVVVLSALLALLQDAKSLALFAAAGGFLAPVLTSTGGGSHVMLFSYYAILNVGIVLIAWFKAWRELNLLGFVFTFVIGSAWGINYYRPEHFASTEPFLILFLLMFVTVAILFAHRQPPHLKGYVDASLVFGVPIVAFTLQAALVKNIEYGMAWSAAGLGAFYILLATGLWRREAQGMRLLTEAFLALGVVFASLAIPLALDGRWSAAAWAVEGAAMIWIGVRQQRLLPRLFALLLQFGAGVLFLADHSSTAGQYAIVNSFYLGCLAISLAGLFSAYYLQANPQRLREWERGLHLILFGWGVVWWYSAGINEVFDSIQYQYEYTVLILFLTLSSALAYLLHRRLAWREMIYPVLALMPMLAMVLLLQLAERGVAHPFAYHAYAGWLLALAGYPWQLWHSEQHGKPLLLRWQHRLWAWLLVLVTTIEMAWLVDELVAGAGTWQWLAWGITPALFILLIVSAPKKLSWPVQTHHTEYLSIISLPLLAVMVFWSLVGGLFSAGNPWPLSYVPVFNPLELAILFVFIVLVKWGIALREQADKIAYPVRGSNLLLGMGGLVFIWINGVVARTVHYWLDIRFDWHALFASTAFQAAIAVVWTVLALLITLWASRRRQRKLWFVGAGLLGIVIAKLFLIDLAGTGTVARIVSFLVVGLLMLLMGYLSPLPPRREEEAR